MIESTLPNEARDKLAQAVDDIAWARRPWFDAVSDLRSAGEAFTPCEALEALSSVTAPGRARVALLRNVIEEGTEDDVAEGILIALVEAAGLSVFTYCEQNSGEVVHRLEPRPGLESQRGNSGREELGAHSDDAIVPRPFRAEVLVLLGLVNECASRTYYVPTYEIVRHLSEPDVDLLSSPRFRVPTPDSFCVFNGHVIYSEPRAILMERDGEIEIACATYNVVPLRGDYEAEAVLPRLKRAIEMSARSECVLGPGDLLALSNLHGVHGRDAVVGHRRLRRVYARRDLRDLRAAVGGDGLTCQFPVSKLLLLPG